MEIKKSTLRKIIREMIEKISIDEAVIDLSHDDLDNDVDMLYRMYFEADYEYIRKGGNANKLDLFSPKTTSTKILKSKIANQVNEINPCEILINSTYGSNFYKPSEHLISLSVNRSALNFIKGYNNLMDASQHLDSPQKELLIKEFNPEIIKGSIHHELVHWIDDTLNNNHISQKVSKASERGSKIPNVNAQKFEIQSQIHNIIQLKRTNDSVWDDLSFDDLIKLSPSLNTTSKSFSSQEVLDKWKRDIKTRMAREGLLGSKMK